MTQASTPASDTALGIDIGGTAIKMGIVARDGSIIARNEFPFDQGLDFDALVGSLVRYADGLERRAGGAVQGVGIAAPGFADPQTGTFIDGTNNVPVLEGRSLTEALRTRLRCPAVIDNDALAAAHCELHFGAGRAYSRFILLTIGTGIGGAVVVDRRVLRGANGAPPEFGALVLDPRGERNYSGLPGTLEHLTNADAFVRNCVRASSGRIARLSPAEVFARARSGDVPAQRAIDETCRWIAQALGSMINILGPQACIIGGGIAGAGDALIAPIQRQLPAFTWPMLLSQTRVIAAERGNDAGLIGAAALALETRAAVGATD
jgi:glucokinase